MATISKPNNFDSGTPIVASQHNSNFDTIYNEFNGNVDNDNIKAGAAIVDSKLAQITTASKVHASSITALTSISDTDNDTKLQLEESSNENIIRMDTAGTERWVMSATGERTMPTQPAFSSTKSTIQTNIALNVAVDISFDTPIFDQGSNFSTPSFIAPVTGKYFFSGFVKLQSADSAATAYSVFLETTAKNYDLRIDGAVIAADGFITFSISILADMSATNTAKLTVTQNGGTQQTDIHSDSVFSGFLAV